MFVSPTKAIKMYNVSKPTLYSDMKTGKLSFNLNDRKKRKINVAELDRLYEKRDLEEGDLTSKTVKSKSKNTEVNDSNRLLEKEVENIRQSLSDSHKREVTLLSNQIEQLQNQVENLNQNLYKALDITALLEDKRATQGSEDRKMEQKLDDMNQVIEDLRKQNERLDRKEKERQKRSEERRKQREIEEAKKSKSIWQKLFQ